MTDKELKTLKDNLWHAADVLRSGAHLSANKYGQPILGLIFLRYPGPIGPIAGGLQHHHFQG